MDAEAYARVKELVADALEIPVSERLAWLSKRCGPDRALLDECLGLLAHVRDEDRPMSEATALGACAGLAAASAEVASAGGERRWRIERLLGCGGMGAVYLAHRADGAYSQQVALKLVHPALAADRETLARFCVERQILAGLHHPNIAQILDGGETADGVPFLAMEYVEGEPITDYCCRHRLEVGERVRLFVRVCRAVHVAHQRLVVHRDLKPGNILVTVQGELKLLDFGVAKLLDPALAAGLTRSGQQPLTPRYASPEQLRGEPLSTASDIYSLGVILYELLAEALPYRRESLPELAVEIISTEPLRPSIAVRAGGPEIAARSRVLAGDLDAIVLKALEKDPARRYASSEALAEDLTRYLEGLPVAARRATFAYRAGKWLRRHRVAAAAALAFVLLGAGFVLSLRAQLSATTHDRPRTARVMHFLVDLFTVADPPENRGATVTARELLDRGAASIRSSLPGGDAERATLASTIGRVYRQLGLLEPAERLLLEAVASARAAGEGGVALADHLDQLGMLRQEQGRYEEAIALHREALAIVREESGDAAAECALILNNLGVALSETEQVEEAEKTMREAIRLRRKVAGERSGEVAESLNNLALLLHQHQGRFDEAEALYRESLAIREHIGAGADRIATVKNNLALLLDDRGKYAAAEALYRDVLELQQRLFGEEHPRIATTLNNLAAAALRQGRADEAAAMFCRCLELRRRALGEDHPLVAITTGNLGYVLEVIGDFAAAEPLARRALALHEAARGPQHRDTLTGLRNLAAVRLDRGEVLEDAGRRGVNGCRRR